LLLIMFFVEGTIRKLLNEFDRIPSERKDILRNITAFCSSPQQSNLVFICTHNSRRSHMAQIWARTASAYFNVGNVTSYSGGTEATDFDPRAIEAMRNLNFKIDRRTVGENPRYAVRYASDQPSFDVFSKRYDDSQNPVSGFAAIMTCTHADENCPVVVGASTRISLAYDDPKDFDGMDMESDKYNERALEIGRELLFAFSQIKRR
jgi:arsenate reductase